VKKMIGTAGTIYWRGADGETANETDAANTILHRHVFFAGRQVARSDNLPTWSAHFYFSDNLGSANVVTNATGGIENESDFYPYGGERVISNAVPQNYKFTGKERDAESGLDDFGARYDASSLGRFMTPDWAAKPVTVPYATFGDPQTLNLYTYVENAPLNRIDPDGHVNGPNQEANNACAGNQQCAENKQGQAGTKKSEPQNNNTDKKKDIKPGDHVFVKVGSGLGLGVHVQVGPVKVEAEASVKSEGEYTPSGKAHNTVVKEAAVSGKAVVGIEGGYKSEDVRDYDMH
jgi:RHS repeat-associated protein